jgi:putative ABC transport system permease protein
LGQIDRTSQLCSAGARKIKQTINHKDNTRMSQWWFYVQYALRTLYRERRWTIFALFSIAAGVAAVVALRTLGLAIGDSLVENARAGLQGDVRFARDSDPFAAIGNRDESEQFTTAEMRRIADWVRANNGILSAYTRPNNMQVAALDAQTTGRPQFVSMYMVDPQTFPPLGPITAQQPNGADLASLLAAPRSIVVSANFAQAQGVTVGEQVRISGTQERYTVTGIVATQTNANIQDWFAGFFGFVYVNLSEADTLNIDPTPTFIAVVFPNGVPVNARTAASIANATGISARDIDTATEQEQTYARVAAVVSNLVVSLGLGALLIGGVGIGNTMLVLARRRTEEIAALKTFGMKGWQVATIFIMQSLVLGVLGSVLGMVLGVLLSGFVNSFGEQVIAQRLAWRIYPQALGYGLVAGMVTTFVFGLIPVLLTLRVRPAVILRPNQTHIPTLGILQSILVLLVVVVSFGWMVGQITGDLPLDIGRGFSVNGTLVGSVLVGLVVLFLGALIGLLWVLVWLLGKIPAFGWVDLRLVLRNLSTQRTRTATTLLAISTGVFALSSITLTAQGVSEVLRFQFSETLGGNVLVFPLLNLVSPQAAEAGLSAALRTVDGVEYTTTYQTYSAVLMQVNGQTVRVQLPSFVEAEMQSNGARLPDGLPFSLNSASTTHPNPRPPAASSGRALTAADVGRPVVFLQDPTLPTEYGIQVGDTLTLRFGRGERAAEVELEVIGIGEASPLNQGGLVPLGALGGRSATFGFTVVQVSPPQLNTALLDISAIPFTFSFDITFLDSLIRRLIDQFAAIPTVVGILSLVVAATITANTVALATLERRRQIGIYKAIGLKARRVLWLMLLENTLIGAIGALLGIGLAYLMFGVWVSTATNGVIAIPAASIPVLMVLLLVSVGIAWVATFLSARSAVGERVLNVLRYE